jgi:hypothetical protein
MKKRNPIFVAAFPLLTISLSYVLLIILDATSSEQTSSMDGVFFLILFCLIVLGSAYTIYWLVSTARVLKRETSSPIPSAILIIVPLANYWWMWRYSQAAEMYVKNKQQAALIFVLIAALGSIGMGIVQDTFNKVADEPDQAPQLSPPEQTQQ